MINKIFVAAAVHLRDDAGEADGIEIVLRQLVGLLPLAGDDQRYFFVLLRQLAGEPAVKRGPHKVIRRGDQKHIVYGDDGHGKGLLFWHSKAESANAWLKINLPKGRMYISHSNLSMWHNNTPPLICQEGREMFTFCSIPAGMLIRR